MKYLWKTWCIKYENIYKTVKKEIRTSNGFYFGEDEDLLGMLLNFSFDNAANQAIIITSCEQGTTTVRILEWIATA